MQESFRCVSWEFLELDFVFFKVFKFSWCEEQCGDYDSRNTEFMISSRLRDEHRQNVRVDLVKLVFDWKVGYLVTSGRRCLALLAATSASFYSASLKS